MREFPTAADVAIAASVHDLALDCAVAVQQRCAQADESRKLYVVTRSTLSVLFHEGICIHRAVRDLSEQGWAFSAPVLMRSMLDVLCSMLIIASSDHSDVAAFQFFYAWTKTDLLDASDRAKAQAAKDIAAHLEQMLPEDRSAAEAWLEKPVKGSYWFSEYFPAPLRALEKLTDEQVRILYRRFSSTAHVGFLGIRMFRDDPDILDINPRRDLRSMGMAMLYSCRILAEITRVRAIFSDINYSCYDGVVEAATKAAEPFAIRMS